MSSLLTNESSLIALTTLRQINKNLNMVQQQISTGKSVSNARDNASIWAVATVMQSDVDSFSAISDSLNLGASTVAVARGASEQVTSLLQEMKNLVVAAQEDNVDRAKIQTDVTQLTEQIDSIVGAAQFNGLNLLSGTGAVSILASLDRAADGTVAASEISIARDDISVTGGTAVTATGTLTFGTSGTIADGANDTLTVAGTVVEGETYELSDGTDTYYYVARAGDGVNEVAAGLAGVLSSNITGVTVTVSAAVLTIANGSGGSITFAEDVLDSNTSGLAAVGNIDVTTSAGATSALSAIEGFIQVGIDAAAAFGSAQKRIDIQNEFITTLSDSMKLGIGALTDTNMEEASARLQSLQVQQQLGIQTLAIANQRPQVLLGLFQ
jgi:flagellin